MYVISIKESYKIVKERGKVHNDSQKAPKLVRVILSDAPYYLHTSVLIIQMDTSLNTDFDLAVYRLSQYVSTISYNDDLVKRNPRKRR